MIQLFCTMGNASNFGRIAAPLAGATVMVLSAMRFTESALLEMLLCWLDASQNVVVSESRRVSVGTR